MNKLFPLISLFVCSLTLFADEWQEPTWRQVTAEQVQNSEWEQLEGARLTWTHSQAFATRYMVPAGQSVRSDTTITAWRGERVGVMAFFYYNGDDAYFQISSSSPWKDAARASWMRYVITDDVRGCGYHPTNLPTHLVADMIDLPHQRLLLHGREVRPLWLTVEVPQTAKPGIYTVRVDVSGSDDAPVSSQGLTVQLRVVDRTLPAPADYHFRLNMWQQPYALSRWLKVEPWSEEHWAALRPYMQLLARGGQKTITTILFYEPWGEQSNDKFLPQVKSIKKKDGTWQYDYTVFDRYVELLHDCGISHDIQCFSMVPWDMQFRYFDEATGQDTTLQTATSSEEYKALWTAFLRSFAQHLKEKGWFEKTSIAMDERGLRAMQDAWNVAQQAVPGIRMSLAGNYHAELSPLLQQYCIAWGQSFPAQELQRRNQLGMTSQIYTACPDGRPNVCSNNASADAAFLPMHAVARGFNGFLRWAWMNWTDDPLVDTRFRMFTPGDTYMIYPGPRSSIRWERMIEGIQAAEKVGILREELAARGLVRQLQQLNATVSAFAVSSLPDEQTSQLLVDSLHQVLNSVAP